MDFGAKANFRVMSQVEPVNVPGCFIRIDGVYTAQRRDSKGGTLTDPLPEGLRLLILADYAAMPVPRDLP